MDEQTENSGNPEEEYTTPDLKACTFSVGGQEFSVDMRYLKGIAELSEIVPLPLTPPYIEGITSMRGVAVPVVNLATLKEIQEEKAAERWLIVLEVERTFFGITVNEMPDLVSDYRGELIDVPEFFEIYRLR
ncbi:MAG: hypothetical protein GXO95_07120 [Nitrospirae bacterium]|nr:hypothetical protein [Nitrospirota bacterium]